MGQPPPFLEHFPCSLSNLIRESTSPVVSTTSLEVGTSPAIVTTPRSHVGTTSDFYRCMADELCVARARTAVGS